MNAWLNYVVEANIGLLLFLLLYKVLLSHETQFSYRRFYLLGGLILSLVFPWLTLGSPVEAVPTLGEALPAYWLPHHEEQEPVAPATLTFWEIAWIGYALVAMLLMVRLLFNITSLLLEARKNPDKYPVIEVDQSSFIAFSFFNLIFISKAFNLSEADKQRILKHEQVHISKWHSVDIVLIELVRILFWFNPLLIYYKKEMSTVHEFEADAIATGSENPDQYCSLLARSALESSVFALANHFNNSLTLKRITMIRTLKQNVKQWKTLMVFFFVSCLFLGIACQDQIAAEINEVSKTTTIAGDFPDHMKPHVERIIKENPGIKLMYVEAESVNAEKIKSLNKEDILYSHYEKNYAQDGSLKSERVGLIVRTGGTITKLSETTKSEDEVFLVAEEPASPQIGITGFYEAVKKALTYPAESKQRGIEGRVFVEFIVELDGTLSNYRVLRGISPACDEEAVRAVKAANLKWNPAKQRGMPVRSKFVMPVLFSLDNNSVVQQPIQSEDQIRVVPEIIWEGGKKVMLGKVTKIDGEPLPRVNIVIKDTRFGTITREDGSFRLELPESKSLVFFSHVGYKTQVVAVD